MRFRNLADWLNWQEGLHPRAIDLGLERVRVVFDALGAAPPAPHVVTVAGTNGKGSVVAFLEAMLRASGLRVGAYTSPHLERYNERVRIDGREVDDASLVAAFDRVDRARGDTSLTYFEFGTLAAFDLFARAPLDVALLEVGLGGRLDAVNVVDADVAVITTIDLDHQDWLGGDRESIGREKAGILRGGRPAVCGDRDPPRSVLARAVEIGVTLDVAGRDFQARRGGQTWRWEGAGVRLDDLPLPALVAPCQIDNAATAIMALHRMPPGCAVHERAIRKGLEEAVNAGRFEWLAGPGQCPGRWLCDVAHNPQAARVLAAGLAVLHCDGRRIAVFGVLADKDIPGILEPLLPFVDVWHLATPDSPRAARATDVAALLAGLSHAGPITVHDTIAQACTAACDDARMDDEVLVFGSFHTVGEMRAWRHSSKA